MPQTKRIYLHKEHLSQLKQAQGSLQMFQTITFHSGVAITSVIFYFRQNIKNRFLFTMLALMISNLKCSNLTSLDGKKQILLKSSSLPRTFINPLKLLSFHKQRLKNILGV